MIWMASFLVTQAFKVDLSKLRKSLKLIHIAYVIIVVQSVKVLVEKNINGGKLLPADAEEEEKVKISRRNIVKATIRGILSG